MAKFCTNCGASLEDAKDNCLNCGAKVNKNTTKETKDETKSETETKTTPNPTTTAYNTVQKSKIAAGLLGIFLGCFGVHNFYLGYTGKAVAQLLLTLLGSFITCGLSAIAASIWGLVEGIMILTGSIAVDGQGNPLGD